MPTPPDMAAVAPSGAASGDYDNDGDIDLFIVRGDIGPNLLYRDLGNLVFEDVADVAGIAFTRSATENYSHSGEGRKNSIRTMVMATMRCCTPY